MRVYFVRHGESVYNTENRHQFPETPLSDNGSKQADAIAHRFSHLPIELIVTSSYTRALQTAQEIQKVKSVPLIQSDLFVERKLPTIFRGKLIGDPEIAPIHDLIRKNISDKEWRYADEENFYDLLTRAQNATEFLATQKKDHFVVVTHGYFLVLLISYILFDNLLTPGLFMLFKDHTTYSNTGLTMCEYSNTKWKLLTWNDYAHLGE